MSRAYQVATLRVEVSQTEEMSLTDVFGRVPTRELVEVLDSDWAKAQGWSPVQPGRLYSSRVADGVEMEIEVGEAGQAHMRLRASATMQQTAEAGQARLREVLQHKEVRDAANLKCYQVVNKVYALAVPRRAAELKYTIVDQEVQPDEQFHRVRIELRLRV